MQRPSRSRKNPKLSHRTCTHQQNGLLLGHTRLLISACLDPVQNLHPHLCLYLQYPSSPLVHPQSSSKWNYEQGAAPVGCHFLPLFCLFHRWYRSSLRKSATSSYTPQLTWYSHCTEHCGWYNATLYCQAMHRMPRLAESLQMWYSSLFFEFIYFKIEEFLTLFKPFNVHAISDLLFTYFFCQILTLNPRNSS